MDWSEMIRELRFLERLKQEALAAQLGVSQASVSQWERGMANPPEHIRARLAARLDALSRGRLLEAVRASVIDSPNVCGLFSLRDGEPIFEAQSDSGFEMFPGLTRDDIGTSVLGKLGPEVDAVHARLLEEGAYEGRIASAKVCSKVDTPDGAFLFVTTHTPFVVEDGRWVLRSEVRMLDGDAWCCGRTDEPRPHYCFRPL